MQAFAHLSDEEWLSTLERSLENRWANGVLLPAFPPDTLQVSWVGSAGRDTLGEAFRFYKLVKAAYVQHCGAIAPTARILDFGIGWGRIARFFMKDVEADRLYGVDTDKEMIAICQDTGVPAHLAHIEATGRLPHRRDFFDLVFAYSVFSHLPQWVADIWLAEIRRVLKPGGLFVATVAPPRFLDHFPSLSVEDANNHPWLAAMKKEIEGRPELDLALRDRGFVYISSSTPVYGDSIMTPQYVHEHWDGFFKILGFLDDPNFSVQAVVTAQKKGDY
jgi:SAM-dependent methyltransferase